MSVALRSRNPSSLGLEDGTKKERGHALALGFQSARLSNGFPGKKS